MPVVEWAPAKVNLTLDVLGRRLDGYHDLESVMQSVALADRLTFKKANDFSLALGAGPYVHALKGVKAEDNLVGRAYWLLKERCGTRAGAHILLDKHVPLEAGLGGGSSDGAAALRGLNRLWQLGLSDGDLESLAAELGSDTAFCVRGGTAFARGRGEILESLPAPLAIPGLAGPGQGQGEEQGPIFLYLVKPSFGLSTAQVFGAYKKERSGPHYASRQLRELLLEKKGGWLDCLHNDLLGAALGQAPRLAAFKALLEGPGRRVHLTGSGPTLMVFSLGGEIETERLWALDPGALAIKTSFCQGLF